MCPTLANWLHFQISTSKPHDACNFVMIPNIDQKSTSSKQSTNCHRAALCLSKRNLYQMLVCRHSEPMPVANAKLKAYADAQEQVEFLDCTSSFITPNPEVINFIHNCNAGGWCLMCICRVLWHRLCWHRLCLQALNKSSVLVTRSSCRLILQLPCPQSKIPKCVHASCH